MLICSLDDFLDRLCPFSPVPQWVDRAHDHLKAKKLLWTPAETALLKKTNKGKAKGQANADRVGRDVGTQGANTVEWEAYRDMTPQTMTVNEMTPFGPLQRIVEALRDCPDPDEKRNANGYRYINCSNQQMGSQSLGSNFKVDAVIANPNIYIEEGQNTRNSRVGKDSEGREVDKTTPSAAWQTAVVMKFRKEATSRKKYENRRQLVSAANHIMNVDARRNWMYGITIENTEMSLWYFSRSYLMKSEPFDFTKDFKMFIRVFLSFLYADDQELGHDPSIVRKRYGQRWCYIYRLDTTDGLKFYRTLQLLYNPRSYRITGHKSRVWKVIEVASLKDLEPISNTREVALKDCWVDQGLLSEKEIQDWLFDRLRNVQESAYAWAPQGLKERIQDGLAYPEQYFMKVVWDWKGGVNKEKPPSWYKISSLTKSLQESLANSADSEVIASSQSTVPSTVDSSLRTSNSLRSSSEHVPAHNHKDKQHYRVIYADVGESLAKATSMSDAVTAFNDIFIALTLMFLARWVHRDVSEGNIILVRDKNGIRAKLSDLEYARGFDRVGGAASTDPKTGTPYFMPLEIHKGRLLFEGPLETTLDLEDLLDLDMPYLTTPSYTFAHDLESLWWIIVWIILLRVKGALPLRYHIFNALELPHPDRESLFKNGFRHRSHLRDMIHPTLQDRQAHGFLATYSNVLSLFYKSGKRQEATSYETVYSSVWKVIKAFGQKMSDVNMELVDPHKHVTLPPSHSISPELEKRRRSDHGGTEPVGSSKKKQKLDCDGLVVMDEEDEAPSKIWLDCT